MLDRQSQLAVQNKAGLEDAKKTEISNIIPKFYTDFFLYM